MHTTTDMTPEQVHTLGLAEVARISAEMDAILKDKGLTDGTIGARVQQLAHAARRDVPEHAGRQEGDARAVPGDPRRGEQGSRRRVRRAARSSASK